MKDIQILFENSKNNPALMPSFLEALTTIENIEKIDFTDDDDWRLLAADYNNFGLGLNDPKLQFELFEKAISCLKNARNFTTEDYHHLAGYHNNAGEISQLPHQKIAWFEKAIDHLMHISNFMPEEYRKLSKLQNKIGIACDGPQQKMIWFEKAIASLEHVPKESLTSDDWREFQTYQRNMAVNSSTPQQRMAWFEKLRASWTHIPENELTPADWADIARAQNEMGACCEEEKEEWFNKAIASLSNIKEFTYENWSALSIYQYNISGTTSDLKERLTFAESAITTLTSHVPEKYYESKDWWHLAMYQQSAAIGCTDNQKKIAWYEKSLKSFQRIPEKDFTQEYFRYLSRTKKNFAFAYKLANDWKKTEDLLYSSLDSYVKLATKEQHDYKNIISIYDELEKLALSSTPQQQLFLFAKNIFLGGSLNFNNNEFLKYYRETLNQFDFRQHTLRRNLLQLMQLINIGITQPHFPNSYLIKWLSVPANRQQFDKILKEIDQAYTPLSLLNMIGEAPNFSVAVVSKLVELETLILELQKENKLIKEENKEMKTFIQTEMNSIYQSRLPIFNNSVDPDLNKRTQPEEKTSNELRFSQ